MTRSKTTLHIDGTKPLSMMLTPRKAQYLSEVSHKNPIEKNYVMKMRIPCVDSLKEQFLGKTRSVYIVTPFLDVLKNCRILFFWGKRRLAWCIRWSWRALRAVNVPWRRVSEGDRSSPLHYKGDCWLFAGTTTISCDSAWWTIKPVVSQQ